MENVRRLPVEGADEGRVGLDELAREGARRMIAAALEAEVADYVDRFAGEVDEEGKRLVVLHTAGTPGQQLPVRDPQAVAGSSGDQ